jgi:hypothetical protein
MLTTEAMVRGWLRGRGDMKGAPTSIPAHSRDGCSFTPASAVKACATQLPAFAVPGVRQVDSPETGELPDVLLYRCRRAGPCAEVARGATPSLPMFEFIEYSKRRSEWAHEFYEGVGVLPATTGEEPG